MNLLESNVHWLDRGSYWLSTIPQGSSLWDGYRKYRLTASKFGVAAGLSDYKTASRLADEMCGLAPVVISERSRTLMDYGVQTEPIARNWYQKKFSCLVKEVGLAVWKENSALGASSDGIVLTPNSNSGNQDKTLIYDVRSGLYESDLLIEIKSVQKFSPLIQNYIESLSDGFSPPPFYHNHIDPCYYAQMQGNLAILNKKWCDYIVYCEKQQSVFTYRVDFNPHYWQFELLPKLNYFLQHELEPRLVKIGKRPLSIQK